MSGQRIALHLAFFAMVAIALPLTLGEYGYYLGCALWLWAAFALAYDLAFGRTGLVSFGHAIFFGVGSYAFALAILNFNVGFWAALAVCLLMSMIVSIAVGIIALRVTGHAFVIITVIFGALAELAAYAMPSITRAEDGVTFKLPALMLGPIAVSLTEPAARYGVFIAAFLFVYGICVWITSSSLGVILEAIRQNEARVALLGHRVWLYKLTALTLSGTLSGLAGAMFALLNLHVSAEVFHIIVSLNPLTAVLVGGAATILGPVIGAGFVLILSDLLRSLIVYSDLLIGLVLIATVLLAPGGLASLGQVGLRRWRATGEVRPDEQGVPEKSEVRP
jgi:branched-chain amino acid transport system permease protein